MNYFLSLILFLFSYNALAEEVFPPNCKPFVVKEDSAILTSAKPAIVMIHNLSSTDLWITHPVSDPGASAGWSSRLQAGNWSALALQGPAFEISCIESKPGHEQQISCADVLGICMWENVTMPAGDENTRAYWAGEDMSLSALTAYIGRRGFLLPAEANR